MVRAIPSRHAIPARVLPQHVGDEFHARRADARVFAANQFALTWLTAEAASRFGLAVSVRRRLGGCARSELPPPTKAADTVASQRAGSEFVALVADADAGPRDKETDLLDAPAAERALALRAFEVEGRGSRERDVDHAASLRAIVKGSVAIQ